ncbi:EAL domain-containing protein [Pseudooceanicola sp. CBS1P-1]|nr:EAL domain-containing protein [Pseudooceanicola endophyticus]
MPQTPPRPASPSRAWHERPALLQALAQGQLHPAFQPVMDLRSGALAGFEVLARYEAPDTGPLSPAQIIPALERHGLMDALLDTFLLRACTAAASWPGQFTLAFNVAPDQLRQDDFTQRIATLVAPTGFPLHRLELEVTENLMVADDGQAERTLHALAALGVRLAIDDFGTGYSSLTRLEAFPFHKLKIDAGFIHGMADAPSKRRIVTAVIGLGHSLGLSLVAEGIETEAERSQLRALGCDLGQGWLFARALRPVEAASFAMRHQDTPPPAQPIDNSPFQQLHQLNTLYERIPVGLCFLDREARHVRTNARFAAMHGLTQEELEGTSVRDLHDTALRDTVLAVLHRALVSDNPIEQLYRTNGRDYLTFCSRVLAGPGDVIGFSVVAIDVTERQATLRTLRTMEEHLRHASELHMDIIWGAQPDGEIDYIGPTTTDLPGETMQARITRWLHNVHPEDHPRVQAEWRATVPLGTPFQCLFRLRGPFGQYRLMRSRSSPYRAADGTILRWYGVITEEVAEPGPPALPG